MKIEILDLPIYSKFKFLTLLEKNSLDLGPCTENQTVYVHKRKYMASYIRNLMVEKMMAFNGFEVGGFFTLKKELFTSISANFVTYLIVLVQFKLSEKNFNFGLDRN